MRTITVSVFALVASVMVPASAVAQMKWTDKAYATLSVGGQAGSHTLTTQTNFDLYEETGTLDDLTESRRRSVCRHWGRL